MPWSVNRVNIQFDNHSWRTPPEYLICWRYAISFTTVVCVLRYNRHILIAINVYFNPKHTIAMSFSLVLFDVRDGHYVETWRVWTRVLHGLGLGPWAGPQPMGRAEPSRASITFCGPGRVRPWNSQARVGLGLVNNNYAACGPRLGLTFPGLGNILFKDCPH